METFEVTYTWAGTLEVEAEDEDSALEVAAKALKGDHPFAWTYLIPPSPMLIKATATVTP